MFWVLSHSGVSDSVAWEMLFFQNRETQSIYWGLCACLPYAGFCIYTKPNSFFKFGLKTNLQISGDDDKDEEKVD